jgi:hypothetical protein
LIGGFLRPEARDGARPRLVGPESFGAILRGAALEMKLELFVELGLDGVATPGRESKEPAKARPFQSLT